jgi:RNA polymerase sigma-70 factor (ECF subfamily)
MNSDSVNSNVPATTELSESEAIRLAQEGNSEGFERLYRLHSRRVYSLCLHMSKDPIKAEDFTQDAFLQVFRKIQSFRGDSLFSTWLHRLTVNVVLMGFRRKKRPGISLDEASELNDESRKPIVELSRPDLNLNGVIDRINLAKAINQLPRGCKKMFLLHDIQGYRHDEISRMVGCSVENSKSQLNRAHARLRKLLPNRLAKASWYQRPFLPNLKGNSRESRGRRV